MSAFIVNPEHIAALAAYTQAPGNHAHCYNIFTKKEIFNGVENFCKVLAQANVKSVHTKYKDLNQGAIQGGDIDKDFLQDMMIFPDECIKALEKFKGLMGMYGTVHMSDADIYNMAGCLEYQCCEVDDWIQTDAFWLIQKIKNAAGMKMADNAKIKWNYEAA